MISNKMLFVTYRYKNLSYKVTEERHYLLATVEWTGKVTKVAKTFSLLYLKLAM